MTGSESGQAIEKPSFLSFLKKSKQNQNDGDSQQSSSPKQKKASKRGGGKSGDEDSTSDSPAQSAKEKAQLRRAQVRKAQVQHRQRKANYVKQLELDISQLREMVTQIQRDSDALKSENDGIRNVLIRHGTSPPPGLTSANSTSQPSGVSGIVTPSPDMDLQLYHNNLQPHHSISSSEEDLMVTLSVNKTMGTPCFTVSQLSPSSTSQSVYSQSSMSGRIELTPAQEMRAINFILALEHCCWNHFFQGDYHHHNTEDEEEKGHTLMASSYLMANAPNSIYSDRKAFTSMFRSSPTLQWQASPISLESLYGLAQSLNPGTEEVTPVQAWFELVARYPLESLFHEPTLEILKREFKGVTHCVMYGAVIERNAFESITLRVLGPATGGSALFELLQQPQPQLQLQQQEQQQQGQLSEFDFEFQQ